MQEEEIILIEATIDADGFPAVLVAFEGHTEVKPVEEIRSFAIGSVRRWVKHRYFRRLINAQK